MPEFVIKPHSFVFIEFSQFHFWQKSQVQMIEGFEPDNFRRRMLVSCRFISSRASGTAIYQWSCRAFYRAFKRADCRLLALNRVFLNSGPGPTRD